MKTKQESSGFSKSDDTPEKRQLYVQKYFDDEGIMQIHYANRKKLWTKTSGKTNG